MNPIEQLRADLASRLPSATFRMDPPDEPSGPWFLDIQDRGRCVVVEWRPERGFGLSVVATSSIWDGYGDMPDETCIHISEALGIAMRRIRGDAGVPA